MVFMVKGESVRLLSYGLQGEIVFIQQWLPAVCLQVIPPPLGTNKQQLNTLSLRLLKRDTYVWINRKSRGQEIPGMADHDI